MQDELIQAKKMTDQAKIESADTINKLTRSLELSQRQCRDILEEGNGDYVASTTSFAIATVNEKQFDLIDLI